MSCVAGQGFFVGKPHKLVCDGLPIKNTVARRARILLIGQPTTVITEGNPQFLSPQGAGILLIGQPQNRDHAVIRQSLVTKQGRDFLIGQLKTVITL